MTAQPVLPYPEPGGREFTSGHSGTDTSKERAVSEDRSGTTRRRQQQAFAYIAALGPHGLTVADLREVTGWHHGQASSALTALHQAGMIARLSESRDRCKVYVLPSHINDRPVEPYQRRGERLTFERVKAAIRGGELDGSLIALNAEINDRIRTVPPNGR